MYCLLSIGYSCWFRWLCVVGWLVLLVLCGCFLLVTWWLVYCDCFGVSGAPWIVMVGCYYFVSLFGNCVSLCCLLMVCVLLIYLTICLGLCGLRYLRCFVYFCCVLCFIVLLLCCFYLLSCLFVGCWFRCFCVALVCMLIDCLLDYCLC